MKEEDLFHEALKQPADRRAAYLDAACRGDADLRERMEVLLGAHANPASILTSLERGDRPDGPLDEPIAELSGTQIGPYKLLQKIGEGGMGVVYMADQTEPIERRVALKIIKPGMDTQQVIARFEAERQALAMMDHPNIARVLDAGTTLRNGDKSNLGEPPAVAARANDKQIGLIPISTDLPYFVMELVKGVAMVEYCDQNRLNVRERLELFSQVCDAVQHAHQKGIIHRDIKPSNILVTIYGDRPVPKVIDFGVAKAVEQRLTQKTMFTRFGQIVGTLEYMSPEQAHLSALDVDTRSDIYSLGVLLYELLTGTTPLDADKLREAAFDEVLRAIREQDPPIPSTRLSDSGEALAMISACRSLPATRLPLLVRGELDWIVMKALDKDRTRRYESAAALAADVKRHLAGDAVEAGPPSIAYKLTKYASKHRAAIGVAVSFAIVLLVATGVSTYLAIEAINSAAVAQQSLLAVDQAKSDGQEISDFFRRDVLLQANPYHQPQGDLKLGAVLDQAAARIGDRFVDQPLVEAEIRWTIGQAYWGLGRITAATDHLQRAVQRRGKALGPDDPKTLEWMRQLADFLILSGDYERGEALLTHVLDSNRRLLGEEHRDTLLAIRSQAKMLLQEGKHDEAEKRYHSVLDVQQRALGESHVETLRTMNELGWLYHLRGDHPRAQKLYDDVYQRGEPRLGEGHDVVLMAMDRLSVLHQAAGRYAQAEKLRMRVRDIKLGQLGERHPNTLLVTYELAHLYWDWGKHDKVEQLAPEVLAAYHDVFGNASTWTSNARVLLAKLREAKGRHEEAESLLRENVDAATESTGDESHQTLYSMSLLAAFLRNRGSYDEAEKLWSQVVEVRSRVLGEEHPDTLTSRNLLGQLYAIQGESAEAEQMMREVLAARRRVLGKDHPDVAESLAVLGRYLTDQRRFAEAEQPWRQCLVIREENIPDDWRRFDALIQLSACLALQQKFEQSEPLLIKAYQGLAARENSAADKQRTIEVLRRMVEFYEAWEKPAEAERWKKKLRADEVDPAINPPP